MKKVRIIANDHFDLIWRRGFERYINYKGKTFIPYSKIQEYYIKDNIKLCEKYDKYKFHVECVYVLEKFLENNPEYTQTIKELFKKGKIYVPFTGNNIVDSNLVSGEGIIRNFLYGYYYLKDNFESIPDGADRQDAFGNSAQLPQIIRGFDVKWLYNFNYSRSDKTYWRGLDGSTIALYTPEYASIADGYFSYRPCVACGGKGCEACDFRGIDLAHADEHLRAHVSLTEADIKDGETKYILVGGEEAMPNEDIMKWAEENKEKIDIDFILFEDFKKNIIEAIENVDNTDEKDIHELKEINVNNSGCYVSRIKTKQKLRENEYRMHNAEVMSVLAKLTDNNGFTDELIIAWKKLFLAMFHDCVTGAMVDVGYEELMDTHKELKESLENILSEDKKSLCICDDETISVYNTCGFSASLKASITVDAEDDFALCDTRGNKAIIYNYNRDGNTVSVTFETGNIEAFSKKEFKIVPMAVECEKVQEFEYENNEIVVAVLDDSATGEEQIIKQNQVEISNEYFKITASSNGILEIYDKKAEKVIAQKGEYFVGEMILEHDEGSPWTTLSDDKRRQGLWNYTKLKKVVNHQDRQTLIFEVAPYLLAGYAINCMRATYSVSLVKGVDKVLFSSDTKWSAQNHRLRIAFPLSFAGKHYYDIPYGVLEREPYEKMGDPRIDGSANWAAATGDYPAINWAGVKNDDMIVSLMNKGTPSYMIKPGEDGNDIIYLTVLRSPTVGTYLCDHYEMDAYLGMMDRGEHYFEFALGSFDTKEKNIVTEAMAYNIEPVCVQGKFDVPDLPTVIGDAYIGTVKESVSKDGIINRVVECRGENKLVKVQIPDYVKTVYETDMKEDIIKEYDVIDGCVSVELRAFEIKTLYYKLTDK